MFGSSIFASAPYKAFAGPGGKVDVEAHKVPTIANNASRLSKSESSLVVSGQRRHLRFLDPSGPCPSHSFKGSLKENFVFCLPATMKAWEPTTSEERSTTAILMLHPIVGESNVYIPAGELLGLLVSMPER